MKFYPMELTLEDAKLVTGAVNQGIDSHLQGVSIDSTFERKDRGLMGTRLVCKVAPNDLRVIIRRLLESGDEESDMLVMDIAGTLGIEEIWLTTGDEFYIAKYDNYKDIVIHVSVFDDEYWVDLFNQFDEDGE